MSSFDAQQQRIDRQKAIAQSLRDSGNFTNADINRVASGGLAVPISPFAAVAKLLQSGVGAYGGYKAGKEQDALNEQKDAAQQAQAAGLMDQIAGKSQMAVPVDQSAAPIGATTNFDSGSGTPVPQQPSQAGAAPVEQNQKRAALAAVLSGANPSDVISMLQGPAISQFLPKPNYTLKEGETRFNGADDSPISTGLDKTYKPTPDDKSLVNIVDKAAPGGYRSIKRMDFKEGTDQLYQKPDKPDPFQVTDDQHSKNAIMAQAIYNLEQPPLPLGTRNPNNLDIMSQVTDIGNAKGKPYLAAEYPARAKALAAFASGKQGDSVRSFNAVMDHTEKVREAAEALQNGKVPALNKIGNWFNTEILGKGDLPALEILKANVGAEITKAIATTPGAEAERQAALKAVSDASTPEQFNKALDKVQSLGAGQLSALQRQYVDATGLDEDRFQHKLSPASVRALTAQKQYEDQQDAAANTAASLPPAARAQLKEGFQTKFGNGQIWTLRNGQPVQVK